MDTVTFLFTDVEGSTRLWEEEPERMSPAMACHDSLARSAVESNHGMIVKMVGDGAHAAFEDPVDGVRAALQLQRALADPEATKGVAVRVRCGLHVGDVERRDNDFFGSVVNRAARIMSAAHGGQVLMSEAVASLVRDRLPAEVALLDLGRVRLRDLASPERIFQLLHPELRPEFPALRSLEATPNNLPQQLASFIGRVHELSGVKAVLRNTRLLTLLGTGGLGKTRLSLQVAADVMEDYPDGVWFVELAPVADGRLVAQAAASVLGVKEETGRPVLEALRNFVKDRRLLLILDNCEHLLHDCAELAKRLLESGPFLRILATSREQLHVAGESTVHVPTLAVPETDNRPTTAALMQSEAERLFIDRAIAGQPDFQVTDESAAAVAEICRRLDGIPLAIELAAARARTLSVARIAARLNDRFHLLTVGDSTVLPRQQTLRASIDWSYDLLSENERALLRRLAVFAGGWTLEAAEAVGAPGDVGSADVLDLLSHLVEKSLVSLGAGGERYKLLETIRQYAQERLAESGEGSEVRTRHLHYYIALAETARQELIGPEQKAWLERLDLERENLLAAHAWCDQAEARAELGLRLVGAVQLYWLSRGLGELGHRVTVEALTRPGAQTRGSARREALFAAGQIGYFTGRYGEARVHLEEDIPIARETGDQASVAGSLVLLGHVCHAQGERAAARAHFEEALALSRESGNKAKLHASLNALAELHRGEGALDEAEPLYEESLALQRERGERANIVISLYNLAAVSIGRGAKARARGLVLEALAITREVGSTYLGGLVLDISTGLAASLGQMEQAARFHGASEAQLEESGLRRDPADEAFLTPLIARARLALGPTLFATSVAAGRALGYEGAMSETQAWLEAEATA